MATASDKVDSGFAAPQSRRDLLIGGGLIAAAAAGYALKPRNRQNLMGDRKLGEIVPTAFGRWSRVEKADFILPPEDELASAIYSQQLTRAYATPGYPPIMLLMAYGSMQSDSLQLHRPEFCYPAGGYRMSNSRFLEVPVPDHAPIPTRFYTATSDMRVEQLLYWTRIGGYFPTTWMGQHVTRMRNSFDGIIPDGILVRLSVVMTDADAAIAILRQFGTELLAAIPPAHRAVIVGA